MTLTTMELDNILKARNQAELYLLEILHDARMDDLTNLTSALKELDKIGEIIHNNLLKKES